MMESNFKLVMGAAMFGIFLGVAGLVFGIVSKNKADELRSDFSQVQALVEKIQRVEESSSGISASATRIRRELDSLRDGTQGALNQASDELTRLRRDLNESIALARGLEQKVTELVRMPPPEREVPQVFVEENDDLPPAQPAVIEAEPGSTPTLAAGGEATYVIQGGDTLTRVAAAHGVTLDQLTAANPGIDPLRLQIGQRIRIPSL